MRNIFALAVVVVAGCSRTVPEQPAPQPVSAPAPAVGTVDFFGFAHRPQKIVRGIEGVGVRFVSVASPTSGVEVLWSHLKPGVVAVQSCVVWQGDSWQRDGPRCVWLSNGEIDYSHYRGGELHGDSFQWNGRSELFRVERFCGGRKQGFSYELRPLIGDTPLKTHYDRDAVITSQVLSPAERSKLLATFSNLVPPPLPDLEQLRRAAEVLP